jgi:hypothetical protein
MIPAKGTRRELAFARRAMRAARYHLAMARTGLRGADDALWSASRARSSPSKTK